MKAHSLDPSITGVLHVPMGGTSHVLHFSLFYCPVWRLLWCNGAVAWIVVHLVVSVHSQVVCCWFLACWHLLM
jgi:hypothetical protein